MVHRMYRSRKAKNTCTEMDLICTEVVMYRKCPPLCTETVMYRKRRNPAWQWAWQLLNMSSNGPKSVEVEKDLWIMVTSDLKCPQQCKYAYSKANRVIYGNDQENNNLQGTEDYVKFV